MITLANVWWCSVSGLEALDGNVIDDGGDLVMVVEGGQ
jgi:hypothetical protein